MTEVPAPSAPRELARYGAVAQLAHWLTALLLVGVFTLGFYMVDLKISPTKLKLFAYHKWLGVSLFVLIGLRLSWRLWHPPPALPATVSPLARRAAEVTHRLLYLLVFLVPLSGWLMSSAKGFQVVYFGVLPIPDLIGKDKELGELLEEMHEVLSWSLISLVGLHLAGALKHHIIDKDSTLRRMLPFGK